MCQMGIFSILEFYLTHLTIGWSILSTAHARQCGTARMMAISKACALTVVAQQVTAQLSVRRKAESAWQPVRLYGSALVMRILSKTYSLTFPSKLASLDHTNSASRPAFCTAVSIDREQGAGELTAMRDGATETP